MIGFSSVFRQVLRGKSATRAMTNLALGRFTISGRALDVGGNRKESHYQFLKRAPGAEIKTLNIRSESNPDYVVDLEAAAIPTEEGSFDTVLCFNLLEHIEDYEKVVAEMFRVLSSGGRLIGSVPFLVNVHPDPHDFQRFTAEKLERMFREQGFKGVEILPISYGPFLAGYTQIDVILPRALKPFWFLTAYLKDAILLRFFGRRFPFRERFVLAYVFSCTK